MYKLLLTPSAKGQLTIPITSLTSPAPMMVFTVGGYVEDMAPPLFNVMGRGEEHLRAALLGFHESIA